MPPSVVFHFSLLCLQKSPFMGFQHKRVKINEPRYEISNNVLCVTSKASDQPAHTRSLIRAFANRLNIL